MGLYIKDILLPEDPNEIIEFAVKGNGEVFVVGEHYWPDAVEVPEPHGRLIDKDALDIYQRAEAAYAEYQEDEDNFYLEGMANGLCEAAKQLSVARTIIPASNEDKQ